MRARGAVEAYLRKRNLGLTIFARRLVRKDQLLLSSSTGAVRLWKLDSVEINAISSPGARRPWEPLRGASPVFAGAPASVGSRAIRTLGWNSSTGGVVGQKSPSGRRCRAVDVFGLVHAASAVPIYRTLPAELSRRTLESTAVSDLSGKCEQKPMPT